MATKRTGAKRRGLRVLIATDGSPPAQAALTTTLGFPWPTATCVEGVIVPQHAWFGRRPRYIGVAVAQSFARLAARARKALSRRWENADVVRGSAPPVYGIVREGRRFSASVIVVGWRGYGAFRRLLSGSVSRGVVRRAPCAVLVVRRPTKEIRQIVIGVDGSPNSHRAVALTARFKPSPGATVTVVGVAEPMAHPTAGLLLPASLRAIVRNDVSAWNARQISRVSREVDRAVTRLRNAGWSSRKEVRSGDPLAELLHVVQTERAELLVVGARAVRSVDRALLGSVAEGALNLSPVSLLVVR